MSPRTRSKTRATQARTKLMMEMILALLEGFAELGSTEEAGPHLHALMGIAHRGGAAAAKPARLIPRRTPARISASRRANASSRP